MMNSMGAVGIVVGSEIGNSLRVEKCVFFEAVGDGLCGYFGLTLFRGKLTTA